VQAGVGVLAVLSRALGVFSVACCAPGVVPGMPQPAVRRGWLSCGPGAAAALGRSGAGEQREGFQAHEAAPAVGG